MENEAPEVTAARRTVLKAMGVGGVSAGATVGLAGCGAENGGYPDDLKAEEDGSVDLKSLKENSTTIVDFGKAKVAIVRGTGSEVHGFSGFCTHQGCALAQKDGQLQCPCHGSRFDEKTGVPLGGPATQPLQQVKLVVEGEKVRRA